MTASSGQSAWARTPILGLNCRSWSKSRSVRPRSGPTTGRLLGPLLLVIAAFGIVASIFRAQSDRVLVRLSRSLVMLVGLGEDTMPLVRWAGQLRIVADASKPARANLASRIVVRIDDPWQAEYWRRTNAYRTLSAESSVRWISDALSVYEVTAELILDRILDSTLGQSFDRLVIVGNSRLALAVCAELAQREREGDALLAAPRLRLADLILYGPDAESLREQHRLRQERFGNSGDVGLILVVGSQPTSENLRATLQSDQRPVLILADDPATAGPHHATYLAALSPTWTILDWSLTNTAVA
jgi:hypothetical protein